jgi:hypothetical protein
MIQQQLTSLKTEYQRLKPSEQKDFESILSTLLELAEKSHESKKNYLKDIKKYLYSKAKKETQEETILTIFVLKNLVYRKNKYDDKIHGLVLSVIWDLLLVMEDFKGNTEFYNFIGYFLRADLPDGKIPSTRQEIVDAYRRLYETFPSEVQKERMRDLAINTFGAAKPAELRQLNNRFAA